MNAYNKALMEFLRPMVNENRMNLIEKILSQRTRYLTVVMEDIFQAQNASAVLRTCDCFGIQDVHIIENRNSCEINPEVELGAAQWLTIHKYSKEKNNTEEAIEKLKQSGYRIVATSPHAKDVNLKDFDFEAGKTAILLGTELSGLSQTAMNLADEFMKIPMMGFTESFNISVSAGIVLHQLSTILRKSTLDWKLHESENENIRLKWIKNSVNNSVIIENAFKKRYSF